MSGLVEISEEQRVKIASGFISAAPPGEFKEVVNDVRVLLGNDRLLTKASSSVFYEYSTEQFTPVKVEGADCLVTTAGSLDGAKQFYDPRTSKAFTYNYLKNEASGVECVEREEAAERWRVPVEEALKAYLDEYFPAHVSAVYGKTDGDDVALTVCIEDHKYNPDNFWNGKWKSKWEAEFSNSGGFAKVVGEMKVQVHYYEDGNVQLLSNKPIEESVQVISPVEFAKRVVELIKKSETTYQMAINENYSTMSGTTFKALRRILPMTHTLIDWHKIHSFNVGKDIMNKH